MKCGKRLCFHGAFASKAEAMRKEKKVHGFIREYRIAGKKRYVVMSRKER